MINIYLSSINHFTRHFIRELTYRSQRVLQSSRGVPVRWEWKAQVGGGQSRRSREELHSSEIHLSASCTSLRQLRERALQPLFGPLPLPSYSQAQDEYRPKCAASPAAQYQRDETVPYHRDHAIGVCGRPCALCGGRCNWILCGYGWR